MPFFSPGSPASAFMQTVLDDADAATALATLGAHPLRGGGFATHLAARLANTTAGIRITTAIPDSTGLSGSLRVAFSLNRWTTFSLSYSGFLDLTFSSGSLGAVRVTWTGSSTGTSAITVRAGFASGFLRINFAIAPSVAFDVQLLASTGTFTAAQLAGWTVTDAADGSLTAATQLLATGPLECTTLAGTGALSGFTTGAFSSTVTAGGDVILTADSAMRRNTSDGSDSGYAVITGGGGVSATRGARLTVCGNEQAGSPGAALLCAGNVANSYVDVQVQDGSVCKFNHDRTVTWHATTLASVRDQVVRTGYCVVAWTATPATGYLYCDGSAVSRTTYAALFAVIGTTFGAGDGSTTFNLPNAPSTGTTLYFHIKT